MAVIYSKGTPRYRLAAVGDGGEVEEDREHAVVALRGEDEGL